MITARRTTLPVFDGLKTVLILIILMIAAAAVIFGLNSIVEGSKVDRMLIEAGVAILVGWLAAGVRIKGWVGFPVLAVTGLGFLIVDLSLNTGNLLRLFLAGINACLSLWRAPFDFPAGISQALPDLLKLINDTSAILYRFSQWFLTIRKGIPSYDALAMDMVWGSIIWLTFIWCSWAVRRRFQILAALLPMFLLLAGSLAYVKKEPIGLVTFLGATLALAIVSEQVYREHTWLSNRTDFSAEIRIDLTFAAIPILSILILLSALAPSFSIKKIADRVHQYLQSQSSQGTAFSESLGLHETDAEKVFSSRIAPGLPRQHLLGSGPELSQLIVMTITTNELPPLPPEMFRQEVPIHYWRGLTYDHYTGHGWTSGPGTTRAYAPNEKAAQPQPNRDILTQQVTLVEDVGQIVYAAGEPITVDAPFQVSWRGDNDSFAASTQEMTYQVTSSTANQDAGLLRKSGYNYPDWVRQRYLVLPNDLPNELRVLARSLTAGSRTPYDQAKAIETYLRTIPYSLDIPVPPKDKDIVSYFLFDLKKGYCDYYATSMVVLARAVGIPARIAIGYSSGSYDALRATYVISEEDAHSWAEIYFPDYGWVEFEPTAGKPVPAKGLNVRTYMGNISPTLQVTPTQLPPDQGNRQIPVFWVVIAGVLILFALRILQPRWRKQPPSPLAAINHIYLSLGQQGRAFKIPTQPGDTPYEFSRTFIKFLKAETGSTMQQTLNHTIEQEIQALINLYVRSLYTPRTATVMDEMKAREIWRSLRFHLWQTWLLRLFKPHRVIINKINP